LKLANVEPKTSGLNDELVLIVRTFLYLYIQFINLGE